MVHQLSSSPLIKRSMSKLLFSFQKLLISQTQSNGPSYPLVYNLHSSRNLNIIFVTFWNKEICCPVSFLDQGHSAVNICSSFFWTTIIWHPAFCHTFGTRLYVAKKVNFWHWPKREGRGEVDIFSVWHI